MTSNLREMRATILTYNPQLCYVSNSLSQMDKIKTRLSLEFFNLSQIVTKTCCAFTRLALLFLPRSLLSFSLLHASDFIDSLRVMKFPKKYITDSIINPNHLSIICIRTLPFFYKKV